MNVHWNKSEPILIDDEILQEAVMEKLPLGQASHAAKVEQIHFSEILNLHLEYRNILRIDHLWEFTSLSRLNLNNNLIEKIEGLDRLVNLTWLNLSFNSIKKIEGLEYLQKLELLNLTNNRISVIENMDALEKLTHFSIANNHVGQLDNVLYLRKFKNLSGLSLLGNPASKDSDYKFFIAAYFPRLMFLDYRLLDEKTKNEASIKYHYVFEEVRHEELQMQQAHEAEQNQKAEINLHTDAFVESLNGSSLFKSMIKDDPEAQTIQCVPGVAPLLQTFEHQMVELCMQLFDTGLAEHKRRETELSSFFSAQAKVMTDYQEKASQILAKFEPQHKERIMELQQLSDPDMLRVKISHCNDELSQLCKSLMAVEFQLVSQLEDVIKKFDSNMSDMINNFSETAQGIFAQCRDLEDDYHQKVKEIVVGTLENVAKDELEEDIPEDVKMLFTDRDTVMDALATSHDNHLLKINDRETQLVTRVNAWKVALIKGIEDKELKQNRMRISDIHRYVDYLKEQLEDFQ
uniref:dynein regulatory complex subunit 3 isoform X1 n=1 Tax=Scatophagus argus TaxID=75038 RepID=UPI001ED82875|nr:dynein regulatory complex subunit 3 isoform X1 [Scatophagus argus]XP_046270928.1 dynein regulatory complex subunit 3 isoform X1 [Scatophagus argus]